MLYSRPHHPPAELSHLPKWKLSPLNPNPPPPPPAPGTHRLLPVSMTGSFSETLIRPPILAPFHYFLSTQGQFWSLWRFYGASLFSELQSVCVFDPPSYPEVLCDHWFCNQNRTIPVGWVSGWSVEWVTAKEGQIPLGLGSSMPCSTFGLVWSRMPVG